MAMPLDKNKRKSAWKEETPKEQSERIRRRPIEYHIYLRWREKAKNDGIEIVTLSRRMKENLKNPEYIKFLKLFDDLDKDKDGNYLCPIHRNQHPMIQPHYEWIKKERREGRNGQSIRFNQEKGDPITFIRNGQNRTTPSSGFEPISEDVKNDLLRML